MLAARFALLGFVTAFVLTAGCAPMSVRLRTMITEDELDEAIADGTRWIEGKAADSDDPQEVRKVKRLVAEAHLLRVEKQDTVTGYQRFRTEFSSPSLYGDFRDRALVRESKAWYRDRTLVRDSVSAHRQFRKASPAAPDFSVSRSRETEIALEFARKTDVLSAYREFRAQYSEWEESQDAVKQVREREVEVAFAEAVQLNTIFAYHQFREYYED